MPDFLSTFFSELSITHVFLWAFVFCLMVWAILWSTEAQRLYKNLEKSKQLSSVIENSLEILNIPMIYFTKNEPFFVANNAFQLLLGRMSATEYQNAILSLLKNTHTATSWTELTQNLTIRANCYLGFIEKNNQTYALYGQSFTDDGFHFWMKPIRDSEEEIQYTKHIIDNVPLALWYRNQEGKIIYCNQVYAKTMGKTPREIIQEQLELFPPSRKESPYQQSLNALETQTTHLTRFHTVIESARQYLEVGCIPLHYGESMGYALDINEIENLEKTLASQMQSHQNLLEYLSTGVSIYGPDTRLAFFNRAYVNLFDFDEKFLLSKPTLGDILEDLRIRRKLPEYANFQKHKKNRMEFFHSLLDPIQELLHQPNGQIIRMFIAPYAAGGIFYLFEDMTEKLGLERQYNTALAVQKEAIDHLFDAIIVFGSDNRLQIANRSFCLMFQTSSNDWAFGKTLYEILDSQKSHKIIYENPFFKTLGTVFEKRAPLEDKLNLSDHRTLRYAYVPLPDGSHLISFVDITDRLRFEENLKERNRVLEEVDILKSRFMRHVSHELQTPLNTLHHRILNIDDSENSLNAFPFNAENQEIINTTHHLLDMIDDMLDLANIESGQLTLRPEKIVVSSFFKSLITMIDRLAKTSSVVIQLDNQCTEKYFYGDKKNLKQAFFHILASAIKYTCPQTTLNLLLSEETIKGEIYLSFKITGGECYHSLLKEKNIKTNSMDAKTWIQNVSDDSFSFSFVERILSLHSGWSHFEHRKNSSQQYSFTFQCFFPRHPAASLECVAEQRKSA